MRTTTDPVPAGDAADVFVGWVRAPGPGRPWRRVCEGATAEECWDKLLSLPPGGDKTVTAGGRAPYPAAAPRIPR